MESRASAAIGALVFQVLAIGGVEAVVQHLGGGRLSTSRISKQHGIRLALRRSRPRLQMVDHMNGFSSIMARCGVAQRSAAGISQPDLNRLVVHSGDVVKLDPSGHALTLELLVALLDPSDQLVCQFLCERLVASGPIGPRLATLKHLHGSVVG